MSKNIKKDISLAKETIINLMRDYDLKVKGIKKIRNAYKIDSNRGKKVLKKANSSEDKLLLVYDALEYMAKKGFRKITRFIVTKYGDPFVRNGDELYYLTDWIDGKECNLDNPKWLNEVVKTMAEMHIASMGYKNSELSLQKNLGKWHEVFHKRSADLLQIRSMVKENKYLTQFDQMFLSNVDKLYEMSQRSIKLLGQSNYHALTIEKEELGGFCHQEFSSRNIIKTKNNIMIVDFDHLKFDLHLLDLGRFMLKFLPKFDWDMSIANMVINNYNDILEINQQHLEVLLAYLMFPHRFWRVVHRYYNKENQWSELSYVRKLEKTLRQAEGQYNFIQNFAKENHIKLDYIFEASIDPVEENPISEIQLTEEGLNISNYIDSNNIDMITEDGQEEIDNNQDSKDLFESP